MPNCYSLIIFQNALLSEVVLVPFQIMNFLFVFGLSDYFNIEFRTSKTLSESYKLLIYEF